jgi:hypothetical protein
VWRDLLVAGAANARAREGRRADFAMDNMLSVLSESGHTLQRHIPAAD